MSRVRESAQHKHNKPPVMKRRGTEKRRTIPPLSPSRYRKEEETQKGGPGGKVPRRVRAEPCPKSDADFSRRRRPRLEISRHPKVLSETLQRSRFQVRLRLWVPHHVGLADQRQKLEGATRREERLDELEAVQVESFSGRAALDKKVPQGWSALGQDLLTRDLAGARPVDKSEPFQLRGLASAALRKASNLLATGSLVGAAGVSWGLSGAVSRPRFTTTSPSSLGCKTGACRSPFGAASRARREARPRRLEVDPDVLFSGFAVENQPHGDLSHLLTPAWARPRH